MEVPVLLQAGSVQYAIQMTNTCERWSATVWYAGYNPFFGGRSGREAPSRVTTRTKRNVFSPLTYMQSHRSRGIERPFACSGSAVSGNFTLPAKKGCSQPTRLSAPWSYC